MKCRVLRHNLQINALEEKGSQNHFSILSSLSFEALRHTSVWQNKALEAMGFLFQMTQVTSFKLLSLLVYLANFNHQMDVL